MIAVTDRPIDVQAVLDAVDGEAEGAVVLFLGRVRNHSRSKSVTRLDYEAYGTMATDELHGLAERARTEHGAASVAVVHRTGTLEVGEVAVAVAVSAGHRAEAFEACRWLIDTLKERAPIWKKEWYDDGAHWVSEHP